MMFDDQLIWLLICLSIYLLVNQRIHGYLFIYLQREFVEFVKLKIRET